MKKLSLELPKYRLNVHLHLVKRRKPLVAEPIIPSFKIVKKKYRKGSLLGRYFRHVFEHRNIQKVFGGGLAMVVAGSAFLPQGTVNAQEPASPQIVIQAENPLNTERSLQQPLEHIKVNQSYTYYHPGMDYGGRVGDPVKSIKTGRVKFAGYTRDGYGNNVIVEHGGGLESLYAHLSKIEVKAGQQVTMDTEIGQVGRTGHATGPHLHLEVRLNGRNVNPVTYIGR